MKRTLTHLTLTALALLLVLPTPTPAQIGARQVVCPPGPIPRGWIKVDELSSSSLCGGNDAWVLELFTNKAPGSAMTICADQPTPKGWQDLHLATSTGQCAGETAGNIKAILRVE